MFFLLKGEIAYDVGSCHDSRTVRIFQHILAPNVKSAIAGAKKVVKSHHERFSHRTDYGMSAALHKSDINQTLGEKVWETRWREAEPYVPPVHRPAIPARKAGFHSKRFK